MIAKNISDSVTLSNGIKMPWVGLGVFQAPNGEEVENAIKYAFKAGYRHVDTAARYGNELSVGKAIRESEVSREEIFLTTKVWNADQGYESTLRAFEESRKKLDCEYIDLYMIHWPVTKEYVNTWKAMEKLYKEGYVRGIGVCNFRIHHLQNLLNSAEIVPLVNQVEYHPLLVQTELHTFCKQNSIQIEAWSPLMRGNLDIEQLTTLAAKYGRTPAQIVLRWHLQNERVIIPKSTKEIRIVENADVFNFQISAEDILKIDALNENKAMMGIDPDNFEALGY